MNPEVSSTATTQQQVLMPRINSPFSAYNLQQTQQTALPLSALPAKGFPSAHMPSPWNTAQYTQAAPMAQKATAWGTSALPPVEIEVLAETSPTSKENTKVSWTSAEQLADAIFPTNADDMQQSLEPFHHGLLNHKMEIETLYKTNEKLSRMVEKQQRCTSDHQTLHSAHEAKHAALRSTIKETQDSAIASDKLSKNNAATLDKHAEWMESVKQHAPRIPISAS
jgi:hypothetical protein